MFWPYLIKVIALVAILTALSTACRRDSDDAANERPALDPRSSGIPFSTVEPEKYQAEIVVNTGDVSRQYFIARSGPLRRTDYDVGKAWSFASVSADRRYLVLPNLSIYAVVDESTAVSEDDWSSFLTTGLLNSRIESRFEEIKTADGSTQYRAILGDQGRSEVVVVVDPASGFPVRQEFYSLSGDARTLTMTIEVRNFKPEAPVELFAIPSGYVNTDQKVLLKRKEGLERKDR
ncbi:MAG TPA: hypothetical protein PKO33_12690, partial [Pyrinomonadaceae bacterium]|nr:hypothetical protein [Pyrinomonadaceae bacterium]